MKMAKTIAMIIVGILCVVFLFHVYSNTMNHKCPYCGAPIEYGDKVMKDGNTMYRYYCTENSWHMVDLYVKIDD